MKYGIDTLDKKSFLSFYSTYKPIGAAPRWHFFGEGERGRVVYKKDVMLCGLRISEKKEILRKPTLCIF
jgi:hypothetical protein